MHIIHMHAVRTKLFPLIMKGPAACMQLDILLGKDRHYYLCYKNGAHIQC